jgi:HEAT repeat protein
VRSLAKQPDDLLCLADRAVNSPETDAKWQIATELGKLGADAPQVESLLLRNMRDDVEYVRRRALLGLADMGSSRVDELVASPWESGDEFQQMAVLYALWKVGSPLSEHYLTLAEAAPSTYLAEYAARIPSGAP